MHWSLVRRLHPFGSFALVFFGLDLGLGFLALALAFLAFGFFCFCFAGFADFAGMLFACLAGKA